VKSCTKRTKKEIRIRKKRSERIRSKITQSQNLRETSFNKSSVVEQMYHVRVCVRCWGYGGGQNIMALLP